MDDCIIVFTSRSTDRMKAEGGSQAWKLKPTKAQTYPYVVCAWNSKGKFAHASEGIEHGAAFLVARISAVETAPANPGRYILRFSEFARVNKPNAWNKQQNPVSYTTLAKLEINPESLTFEKMDPTGKPLAPDQASEGRLPTPPDISPLSISAAKPRVAAYYEVPVESIEIVIRG